MTGLSLLETMIALAVGAVVLVGAIVFYQTLSRNANVNKTMTDMNNIRSAYKAYYDNGNTLSTAIDATTQANQLLAIQDAGFLPNPLNDAWGQAYVVSLGWYPGNISIAIPGLASAGVGNDKNCQAIARSVQGSGGFVTTPRLTANYQCAFSYRFP